MSQHYSAPWSRGVKLATRFSASPLGIAPVLGLNFGPHQVPAWRFFTLLIPLIALILAIFYGA
jgi:hypothetical protein